MNLTITDIQQDLQQQVKLALVEDIGSGDITAELIPAEKTDTATIITREDCIVCGVDWVNEVFQQLDSEVKITWHVSEGDHVDANTKLATLEGNTRSLLTGERAALNFLQFLSGIATKANQYLQVLGDSKIKLLDTRKTVPGLRTAQKYAVTIGGCHNHRIGLFDAYLIKENHIAGCGSIEKAITTAKQNHPNKKVEVEVETLQELEQAITAGADIVMLDNFSNKMLGEAMKLDKKATKYELSGNLTDARINELKAFNIDFLSFGALTKHVNSIDLSMRLL